MQGRKPSCLGQHAGQQSQGQQQLIDNVEDLTVSTGVVITRLYPNKEAFLFSPKCATRLCALLTRPYSSWSFHGTGVPQVDMCVSYFEPFIILVIFFAF